MISKNEFLAAKAVVEQYIKEQKALFSVLSEATKQVDGLAQLNTWISVKKGDHIKIEQYGERGKGSTRSEPGDVYSVASAFVKRGKTKIDVQINLVAESKKSTISAWAYIDDEPIFHFDRIISIEP